jgi:hypothetical protein
MNNRVVTSIDTEISGLVIQIEHNLADIVYPFLFQTEEFGQQKIISLYDPIIAEAKIIDKNIFQISFTGEWKGYLHLVKLNVSGSSYLARLEALESNSILLQEQINKLVNSSQWKQMNTYTLSEIDKLKKEIEQVLLAQEILRKDILNL